MDKKYVIGVDYGSDSCRALLLNAETGEELAEAVSNYRRWAKQAYCDASIYQYRQHPQDYIDSLKDVVCGVVNKLPAEERKNIVALACDATGSTPAVVNQEGTPLALLPEFAEDPDAMFVLWKDHSAYKEADEINALAHQWKVDYTDYSGGTYSAEWAWSKMIHVLRVNERVAEAAYSWVECCDWLPAMLTGNTKPETMKRNRCVAGHKAMWHDSWDGLPSFEFLGTIEPKVKCFEGHLYRDTVCNEEIVGHLTAEWAETFGLSTDVIVAMGAIDAHVGAIGAGIKPGTFVRVMGTSTCDMMVASDKELKGKKIQGICGQVNDAILTGYVGLEAGQSAFGDVYSWFNHLVLDPVMEMIDGMECGEQKESMKEALKKSFLNHLTAQAEALDPAKETALSVDWFNGRRTPFANQKLKGAMTGLTLGTSAAQVYRALVEATAFGSKAIVDSIQEQGVSINDILAIGGISHKSPFVMQVLSDVLGRPIHVAASTQTCALGAAMLAATAGGVYPTLAEAQIKMSPGNIKTYYPNEERTAIYAERYQQYVALGGFIEKETNN